jgi:hypothetical protein
MPRLLYVIPEINMSCQHRGLIEQMKERKIDFKKLKPGDVVAFLNRREDLLRVLCVLPEKNTYGFLGSYRSPHGRVPLEAIQYITQSMGGTGFDMTQAIRMGLEDLLGRKNRRVIGEA